MRIIISKELRQRYPGFNAHAVVCRDVKARELDSERKAVELSIRKSTNTSDIHLIRDYNEFFSQYGKKVPLEFQMDSIIKGKNISAENPLAELLFMLEMKHATMISGHELSLADQELRFEIGKGTEEYVKLGGKPQKIKEGDILLKSSGRILASLLYGPDDSSKMNKSTKDIVFVIWFYKPAPGGLVEAIASDIESNLHGSTDHSVASEDEKEYTVTPWEVKGDIDYGKLIKDFGVKPIDQKIRERIRKITEDEHMFIRRNIFFAHMYMNELLDEYEKGNKFYLYTGRAPSGPVHLGHLIPWVFTKWLQDAFDVHLLFQIPDEEKFLFKKNLTLKETKDWAYENILDIIAVGFDPMKTKIFLDTEYAGHMYGLACQAAKKMTFSTIRSTFGFNDSNNIGTIFYTAMQSVPAFLPTEMEGKKTRVLIPCAIDQDVHFRLTRDVAESLGYPKPATILCRFLPALSEGGKLSSSGEADTTIWATDTPAQVKKKVLRYAFSGGRDTVEEHRKLGGNPDIDVAYQWLTFFEEDDRKLKQVHDDYRSGKLLSGELKLMLVEQLNRFLAEHQKRRHEAKKHIEKFMLRD